MTSIIDQLQEDYPGRVQKFNIVDNQELTRSLGIRETPTIVFIKNNIVKRAIIGSNSGKELLRLLQDV
jgi:thioredoxin-like negative regulator of GroEL